MSHKTFLEEAIKLRPVERAHLVEGLIASLEKPDADIDSIWEQEALKRYKEYKQKRLMLKI